MTKRKNTLDIASEYREFLLYETTGGAMGKPTPKPVGVEFSDKNKFYELMLKQSDIEIKSGVVEQEENMFDKIKQGKIENGSGTNKRKKSTGADKLAELADNSNGDSGSAEPSSNPFSIKS